MWAMSITGHSISQWLPCPMPSWVPNTIQLLDRKNFSSSSNRQVAAHRMTGLIVFCPLGVVITWHCAVECLVSVSNCVIYILPLLLSSKYDDIVASYCDNNTLMTGCRLAVDFFRYCIG